DLLLSIRRVMAIVAHPDDAEIQCGGTIARLVHQGTVVSYVLCTSGNRGTSDLAMTSDQLTTLREREQRAAAALLGVSDITFLRHDDGDLAYAALPLRQELTRLVRQQRPDVIITHDPFAGAARYEVCYLHPDHRAAGQAAFEATFFCAGGPLFYPDQIAAGLSPHQVAALYLMMSDNPDGCIDISDTFAAKVAAIQAHHSQWGRQPDLEGFFRCMAEQAGARWGVPLAEAFRLMR
ncbi:MAG: PIG-L family deacetylase, partial [Chloroflexi bacterium]|nr:PIG-L family deacetylase [Chloroflexota bacterium]